MRMAVTISGVEERRNRDYYIKCIMIITSSKNGEIVIIMNKTESCSMMHRHKKIIYGILIILHGVFSVFSVREIFFGWRKRTSSEPGDTEETATTQVPVTTEQTAGEETHTTSDAQMTVLDVRIQDKIQTMSLEEKVGQMFFVKNDGRLDAMS